MKHIIEVNSSLKQPSVKTILVDEESAGQRLDNFLMRHLKGVPKTHIYRIIRSGEVRVNKGRASADDRVGSGDAIRIPPVRLSERSLDKAHAMSLAKGGHTHVRDFTILMEDDCLLAIDKPSGVSVHGGSGVSFGVIEQLRMARPEAKFLELVHRLDRETSGILLIAKKRSALKHLQNQFRERETEKTYLCMVKGTWPVSKKVLNKPLHKYLLPDGERRVKVVSKDDPDGMPSVTLVKVKPTRAQSFSFLEVVIKTGRTHQIRVHLANEGNPILGDDKYGDFDLNKKLMRSGSIPALKRMFLHAWRLSFKHPLTQVGVDLEAPLSEDLAFFSALAAPPIAIGAES